jgi:hypothetical protein
VGIALMPGQHRQDGGTQNVARARGVRAGQLQRAAFHPGIETSAQAQKLGEERQLPQRGDRRLRIPLDVDATAKGVHRHRAGMRHQRGGVGFTLRVSDRVAHGDLLAPIFQRLGSREARCNCSF